MPRCPVCLSETPSRSWTYREYSIFGCADCGLQFAWPLKAAEASWYEERYGGVISDAVSSSIPGAYRFFANWTGRWIERYSGPGAKKVLDVGCGPGYLLLDLKARGFDCHGIDFNPAVVRVARETFGLNAEVRTVEELAEFPARYDVVLLSHVLEHVADPLGLLNRIAALLNPRGILLADVPNPEYCRSRAALRAGKLEWGNYPPHHLTFWSPRSLRTALERAGLAVLESGTRPYPERLQTRHSFVRDRHWPDNGLTTAAAFALEGIGRAMRLSGMTVYAVARKDA